MNSARNNFEASLAAGNNEKRSRCKIFLRKLEDVIQKKQKHNFNLKKKNRIEQKLRRRQYFYFKLTQKFDADIPSLDLFFEEQQFRLVKNLEPALN